MSCTGTVSVTGAPGSETGSSLLIGDAYYQDVRLSCSATLGNNCNNAGLVFGFVDRQNFWVLMASRSSGDYRLYEVSGGTWNLRSSGGSTTHMTGLSDTNLTIPAGQVAVWAGSDALWHVLWLAGRMASSPGWRALLARRRRALTITRNHGRMRRRLREGFGSSALTKDCED